MEWEIDVPTMIGGIYGTGTYKHATYTINERDWQTNQFQEAWLEKSLPLDISK